MKQLIDSRQYQQALDLFDRQATLATNATLALALKASTKLGDEKRGVRIHEQLSPSSRQNPFIQTALIHFYMQCHRVNDAERVFSTIPAKNVVAYGAMMKGYLSNKMYSNVIDSFETMPVAPDGLIIAMLFEACGKLHGDRATRVGNDVLRRLSPSLLQHERVTKSAVAMLIKFNELVNAERLFAQSSKKTIVAYVNMMQNYVDNGLFAEALNFVETIPFKLNDILYVYAFKACAAVCDEASKALGKRLLENMPAALLQNIIVVNTIIHMLAKFGEIERAEQIFEQTEQKTIVSYGALTQGYLLNNLPGKALDLYEKIPMVSNEVAYTIVYKACAELCDDRAIRLGKKTVEQMPEAFLSNPAVTTAVVHMFMQFAEVETAERYAKLIKTPRRHLYGALISGYKTNEQPQKCLTLFDEMKKNGIAVNAPLAQSMVGACAQIGMRSISEAIVQQISHVKADLQLRSSLIDMWGKSGHVQGAEQEFRSIAEPNVYIYTNMINAYGLNGMGHDAVHLYHRMPKTIRNDISHVCALNACSHAGLVAQARSIFDNIEQKTKYTVTTMVDGLSRLSLFADAQQLIDDFEKSHPPNPVMYMALLSGARNHRQVSLSQQLYERMQRLFPDRRDDLIAASVLVSNAYSSSGDDAKAREVRLNRIKRFGKNVTVGVSMTEVNGELVRFHAHDRSHPRSAEIYAKVDQVAALLQQHGHEFDATSVTRPLHEGEDIASALCGHSEKLAICYNLIQQPRPTFIQVTKNLRVCGDCHRATKLIAKIFACEIVVRDANRFHRFTPNGQCSCNDHF